MWDFPDGQLAHREYAAFLVSEMLGFHIVPQTVLRDGPFGIGMVQLWIDIDEEIDLANFLGFVLPFIEVGIGLLLIVGIWVRLAAIAGGALMVMFIVAIGQAWIRGISLDCGCFGKGGLLATDELPVWNYTVEIARDIALAGLGGYLYRFPQGKLGLDK